MTYRLCGTSVESVTEDRGILTFTFTNGDTIVTPSAQTHYREGEDV